MPGWSTEIANEFLRLAQADRTQLNQLQLQDLVYIAHGWQLASSGQPLTGDRPEADETGPIYRRLARALAEYGLNPITDEVMDEDAESILSKEDQDGTNLDQSERDLIALIYQNLGCLESWQLSALTRKGDTPWRRVFADGAGRSRDIPHRMVGSVR